MKFLPFFRRHQWFLISAVFVVFVVAWSYALSEPKAHNAPIFDHARMTVRRADGKTFPYDIEVATTEQQEMYGLMFRQSLPADHGMIFVYNPEQNVSMWMKNTFIPLDMLFVRQDGTITKIITHAVPFDLTPLSSDGPVHAVIEINAGEVENHGFQSGDKVLYSAFSAQP